MCKLLFYLFDVEYNESMTPAGFYGLLRHAGVDAVR